MTFAQPIGQLLAHPPLGFTTRELITGTFSGSGDLTRVSGPVNVNAYGLTWSFFTIPEEFGIIYGSPNVYVERILQLSTIHQGADNHQLVSEYHDFHAEGLYWMWENAFPQRIHYEITVGCEVVFYWILATLPSP